MRNYILKQVDKFDINNFDGYLLHKGLKYINKYYYIENKLINYYNSFPRHNQTVYDKLYNYSINFFDDIDRIFLYKLSLCENDDILNTYDLDNMDKIVSKLKKDTNFTVVPQTFTPEQCNLIIDTKDYILDYCENNNLKLIIKYYLTPMTGIHYKNREDMMIFTIQYNNYEYKYIIRKLDNKLIFKIKLRNNKEYHINLYNKTDFNNVVNCMYHDAI